MKQIWLLAFLLLAQNAHATKIVASEDGPSARLGMGYSTVRKKFEGNCLDGTQLKELFGVRNSNAGLTQQIARKSLASELGIEAGGRVSYGVSSMSASAKFFTESKSDDYSINVTYQAIYNMGSLKFDETGAKAKFKPTGWDEACGDEYVEEIKLGAQLYFNIRVEFSSRSQKESFEAQVKASGSMYEAYANLKKSQEMSELKSTLTVQALQIGGDVSKLSEILKTKESVAGPENKSTYAVIGCSFGKFNECDRAIEGAIDYAANTFPKQLEVDQEDPQKGPSHIAYWTKTYKNAGIPHSTPPVVSFANQQARRQVTDIFIENLEINNIAFHTLNSRLLPLHDSQRKVAQQIYDTTQSNTIKLADISNTCWNELNTCSTLVKEADALAKFNREQLIFPPMTFLQYCGEGLYMESEPRLPETIRAFVEYAKHLDPNRFKNNENPQGATFNTCEVTNFILKQQDTIDFRKLIETGKWNHHNYKVHMLDPLRDMTKLKVLRLPHQLVVSTEPLKYLNFIEEVDLSNNRIIDGSDLSNLTMLKRLDLSQNRLRNLSGFGDLRYVEVLDLRNNLEGIVCPTWASLRTCLVKGYSNIITVNATAGKLPFSIYRPSVALLADKRSIFVSSGGQNLIFDTKSNTVREVARSNFSRRNATSTTLKDGRVLTVGGYNSETTAELYNPADNTIQEFRGLPARSEHAAQLLMDGRVLITGGWTDGGEHQGSIQGAMVFHPSGKFESVEPMSVPRARHTMTQLADGRVVVMGGYSAQGGEHLVEIFDPRTNAFSNGGSLKDARMGHTATLLLDGNILVAGGQLDQTVIRTAELYNPETKKSQLLDQQLTTPRAFHTASLAPSGEVILAGGLNSTRGLLEWPAPATCTNCIAEVEIFDPQTRAFTDIGVKGLTVKRAMHVAVPLGPSNIYIFGGTDNTSADIIETISHSLTNAPNALLNPRR